MTRFETTIVTAAVLALGLVHGPAFGQKVIIGDDDTPRDVTPSVKIGKTTSKSGRPSRVPAEPPKPEEPTFVVHGGFETTKEKARESAIRAAVEKVHLHLLEQNPPVTKHPTVEMVRSMLIPHSGASQADVEFGRVTEQVLELAGNKEPMYQVEVAVKVRPQHVRELRARERSSEALWVLAGLGGLAAVVAVFFRIDAWTRGYLTSWLVLGTAGAVSLLIGLWWMAK